MLVQYFKRPSRIEELRSCPGSHLLEEFAKELAAARYQWVAARQHIRTAEHFLRWIGHRGLSVTTVEERYCRYCETGDTRCSMRGSIRSAIWRSGPQPHPILRQ